MDPSGTSVTILIPARDEAARIGPLVRSLKGLGYTILVVDDGSADDTAARASAAGAEVLKRAVAAGKGAALREGLARLRERAEVGVVVLMDGDGQHRPEDVRTLLDAWKATGADLVLGVRDLRRMPWMRAAWTLAMNAWLSLAAGRWLRDTQCGLRLLSHETLRTLAPREAGYAVDTEIVLRSLAASLPLAEAPIGVFASPRRSRFLDDARRAAAILRYALPAGARPLQTRASKLLGFVLFALLLLATFRQGHRLPRLDASRAYAEEMEAALGWLKAHSEPGSVVVAHWIVGHQIATLADRPVIATTKVYPSEANDTAARYRDIARFFFSEDEDAALAIAARYGASYVFVNKNFPAYPCAVISACEYATPNRRALNRLGLTATIAGKMSLGGSFKRFQQIWDSSRFAVYRVTDRPVRLAAAERASLLALARRNLSIAPAARAAGPSQAPDASLPVVQVSLWKAGLLRGLGVAASRSLPEAIAAAAREAAQGLPAAPLRREDMAGLKIVLALGHDDYAPLRFDPQTRGFSPLRAFRLRIGGRTGYMFPHLLLPYGIRKREALLARLCSEAGARLGCEGKGAIETFSAEAFAEGSSGTPEGFEGPVSASPDVPIASLLRERAALASDWLARSQTPDGRLPFLHDPINGGGQPFQCVREALAGEALVEAYRTFRDARYLEAARRAGGHLASLERASGDRCLESTGYLAFSGRLALSLYEATGDPREAAEADRRMHALWRRRTTRLLGWGDETMTYYALSALARYLAVRRDPSMLVDVEQRAVRLRHRFKGRRILANDAQSLPINSYLIDIFSGLYQATGKLRHAEAAFEVARWVAEHQQTAGPPAVEGSVPPWPRGGMPNVRQGGRMAEGLLGAYEAGRCLRREGDTARYAGALDRAFRWMARLQVAGAERTLLPKNEASSALGAFRHDALNPELWNDAAGHFLIPALRYYRDLTSAGPRCPEEPHARKG